MDRCVEVYKDSEQLRIAAAAHWIKVCAAAIDRQGACHIALAGGSTPKALYLMLAQANYRERIDWQRVHIYFGDERHVPHSDPQSNYRMAREAFLDTVPIPRNQIHAIPYLIDSSQASSAYEQTLTDCVPIHKGFPRFDLIWLGMGDDGHTASLFPGTSILNELTRFCADAFVTKLSCWRVSLTFPVINNADNVFLLVSGESKAQRLAEIFSDGELRYPVQQVSPRGKLCWLMDRQAAQSIDWSRIGPHWQVTR